MTEITSLPEFYAIRFAKAEAALTAAGACLAEGLFDSAVDRAYYAMFHAAAAGAFIMPNAPRRTDRGDHRAVVQRLEVLAGWRTALVPALDQAFQLRETAIGIKEPVGEQTARDLVVAARAFIDTARTNTGPAQPVLGRLTG